MPLDRQIDQMHQVLVLVLSTILVVLLLLLLLGLLICIVHDDVDGGHGGQKQELHGLAAKTER